MAEEVITQTAATNEPVAPAPTETGSAPVENVKVPVQETNTGDAGAKVEAPKESIALDKKDFAWRQLREERSQFKQKAQDFEIRAKELEARTKELEALTQAYGIQPNAAPQSTNGLGIDQVKQVASEILRADRLSQAQDEARIYLYQQEDVQTKEHVQQIQDIMEETGLGYLLEKNPASAVMMALREWRDRRGAPSPKANGSTKLQEKMAGGVPAGPVSKPSGMTLEAIKAMPREEYSKLSSAQRDALWQPLFDAAKGAKR